MKKQKVLLVSKDKETLRFVNEMFIDKYDICEASNDKIAIEIISDVSSRPNLTLIDAHSLQREAYELASELKNNARTSEIPIIFILDGKDDFEESFILGAADCVLKPLHPMELKVKLKNILQLFKLRDSLSNALESNQRNLLTVKRQLVSIDEHVLYISLDLESNVRNVSTALMRLLGCNKENFIANNRHCLSKQEFGEKKIKEIFDEVKNIRPYETELCTRTNDDKEIWLSARIAKDVDYYDNHVGYIATFGDITDKKIIQQKNKELDIVNAELDENLNYLKQFKKAVEEASIFSITDDKGIIKEVNKNFELISGYSEDELLNKPHNLVRHEDMPKEAFKDMWDTIQSGKIWKGMVKNKRKDGKAYYVISEVVPILNADGSFREYISIRSDVTELEEYRQLLKNELDTKNKSLDENINYIEQYEEAINNSMGIIKTDMNHMIYNANEKICELSGYSMDELVGMNSVDLRDEIHKNKEDCQAIAASLSQNQSVSKIMTNVKKNGDKYFLNTVFYPITDLNDNVVENIQTMYDITELIKLNEEIENTQREVVFTMGAIGETRSKETGYHVKRVAEYSYLLAVLHGLSEEEAQLLKQASPMHDIGKVAIPDSVLNKPARLTFEEFEIMKTHSKTGYEMLKHSNRPILKASAEVALTHHEKYDGSGYPNALSGEDIPIFGRITALADVFDALGNERAYKKAWELEQILELFKEERGKHFDPNLIDIFFEHIDKFLEVRDRYK